MTCATRTGWKETKYIKGKYWNWNVKWHNITVIAESIKRTYNVFNEVEETVLFLILGIFGGHVKVDISTTIIDKVGTPILMK